MEIGEPKRTREIEPVHEPVPEHVPGEPTHVPERDPAIEPVGVPDPRLR